MTCPKRAEASASSCHPASISSRPSFAWRLVLLGTLGFVGLCPKAEAHRLDEYLQAIRVSVARDRIDLQIDLTPGASIANTVVWLVDSNRDGVVSVEEGDAYAESVLSSIAVELDGSFKRTVLTKAAYPSIGEMKAGEGVIRLRAEILNSGSFPGTHRLHLRNDHQPGVSVYLANATQPGDNRIEILDQSRDETQRNYTLEYRRRMGWGPALGAGAVVAAAAGIMSWRLRRPARAI